jgi:hypothetical protein
MTVSQELREWAMHDELADVNTLSSAAWFELSYWRQEPWGTQWGDQLYRRTFALLVACALEDE